MKVFAFITQVDCRWCTSDFVGLSCMCYSRYTTDLCCWIMVLGTQISCIECSRSIPTTETVNIDNGDRCHLANRHIAHPGRCIPLLGSPGILSPTPWPNSSILSICNSAKTGFGIFNLERMLTSSGSSSLCYYRISG